MKWHEYAHYLIDNYVFTTPEEDSKHRHKIFRLLWKYLDADEYCKKCTHEWCDKQNKEFGYTEEFLRKGFFDYTRSNLCIACRHKYFEEKLL